MTGPTVPRRKLIEVALPLEKINAESAREKSIRHGHPSTLHLWWARRPLAAARAVLFAQLVDDPSSNPSKFPTERAVTSERRRLHELIERLVLWDNAGDERLMAEAHREILNSTEGNPPKILDPFAGGGTIPLEAQRLGLEVHASDLNPVAVLITKALTEIPPRFAGRSPVFPGVDAGQLANWPRATGLAEDVRRYGQWMRDEAEKRIGHLYPQAAVPGAGEATVIAWIWARTVICPNPACGIVAPLARSWWLSNKKGREAWIQPAVINGKVVFAIGHGLFGAPTAENNGTVGRSGAYCIACEATIELKYIRGEGRAGRLGTQLMTTVAEGNRTRIYLAPTPEQESAAAIELPGDLPDGEIPSQAPSFRIQAYGLHRYTDLFTPRQLWALTTFSDLVAEVREQVVADGRAAGMNAGERLEAGGTGASAYADAVATYLGLAVSKLADRNSTIVNWYVSRESTSSTFARQALPMTWDFAEVATLGNNTGSFSNSYLWTCDSLDNLPARNRGEIVQADAMVVDFTGMVISTDPPYYDNIGYSDLSDFFYIWLRRSLRLIQPALLSTLLVPKADELVANPYRHGGREGAQRFFEDGFKEVFRRARLAASTEFPITVYYAFKQAETTSLGQTATGWETILEGMIGSGWTITATWPMRSEASNRMLAAGTNALASSIVLALRPRPADARRVDQRGFVAALKDELPQALRELLQGAIAPVDLQQAAIGPGMAVYSRYSAVVQDDGSLMKVRTALARINEILDEVLFEQEGDFDPITRFAIAWFRQQGFTAGAFGDADNIARGRNASLEHIVRSGILTSRAGKVTLLSPSDLPEDYDPATDDVISEWEVVLHLIRVLGHQGLPAAAKLLARVPASVDRAMCKELAFLLFSLAEDRKLTKVAVDFNALGTAWNDLESESRSTAGDPSADQPGFEFGDD